MITNKQLHQLVRFGLSGVAGFIVDASLVALCAQVYSIGPVLAQVIAFSVAVTVTWIINRYWTFAENASKNWIPEFARYLAANSIGATINNSTYLLLVVLLSIFRDNPTYAVAVGSLAGMISNFIMSRQYAFRSERTTC